MSLTPSCLQMQGLIFLFLLEDFTVHKIKCWHEHLVCLHQPTGENWAKWLIFFHIWGGWVFLFRSNHYHHPSKISLPLQIGHPYTQCLSLLSPPHSSGAFGSCILFKSLSSSRHFWALITLANLAPSHFLSLCVPEHSLCKELLMRGEKDRVISLQAGCSQRQVWTQ